MDTLKIVYQDKQGKEKAAYWILVLQDENKTSLPGRKVLY